MAQHKDAAGQKLFDFESRSHNHIGLADAAMQAVNKKDADPLPYELEESMRVLQHRLGKSPGFIALPHGAGGFDREPDTQAFPIIYQSACPGTGVLGQPNVENRYSQ